MTDDLAAFIAARLDEDERYAKAAAKRAPGPWVGAFKQVTAEPPGEIICVADTENADISHHIERQEPARTLREVAAMRAHVRAWGVIAKDFTTVGETEREFGAREALEAVLEADAAIWDDHPDYREEWKP